MLSFEGAPESTLALDGFDLRFLLFLLCRNAARSARRAAADQLASVSPATRACEAKVSKSRLNPLDHPFLLAGAAVLAQQAVNNQREKQNPAYYAALRGDPQVSAAREQAKRKARRYALNGLLSIPFAVAMAIVASHYYNRERALTGTTLVSEYNHAHSLMVTFGALAGGSLLGGVVALLIWLGIHSKANTEAEQEFHLRWLAAGLEPPVQGMWATIGRGQAMGRVSYHQFWELQERMYATYFQRHYDFTPTAANPAPPQPGKTAVRATYTTDRDVYQQYIQRRREGPGSSERPPS